jgi:dephospho-CoA kinase
VAPTFVGLTGGIGAGKSEALAAFAHAGAATVATDDVVHELLRSAELRDALVERWGQEVAPGGELDRRRVGEIVFERPEELEWLESELHPRVGKRLEAWRASLPRDVRLAVVEIPLLFETGMEKSFDTVVSVVADDELRERRLAGGGFVGLDGRLGRQLSQDEKAARAAHVVRNDGTLAELHAKIAGLARELTENGQGNDDAERE